MFRELFLQAGFNSSDAEIYEAILFLGRGTPKEISKHSNISRENTYKVLENLEKNNLVTKIGYQKKIKYIAESPLKLLEIFENKEKELKDTKDLLNEAVSKMKIELESTQNKPVVTFIQGEEGLKKAFMDSIDGVGGIQYEIQHRNWTPTFRKWLETSYIQLRVKRGIKKKVILADSDQGRDLMSRDEKENRETLQIKKDQFPLGSAIIAYGNKLILASSADKKDKITSIVIDHEIVSSVIQSMMKTIWVRRKGGKK